MSKFTSNFKSNGLSYFFSYLISVFDSSIIFSNLISGFDSYLIYFSTFNLSCYWILRTSSNFFFFSIKDDSKGDISNSFSSI